MTYNFQGIYYSRLGRVLNDNDFEVIYQIRYNTHIIRYIRSEKNTETQKKKPFLT